MIFRGRVIQGWSGEIRGKVLITRSKISFLGDIDLDTGKVVGTDLGIKGESISSKILIFQEGRGSTAGSNVIYGLSRRGLAPKLIATRRAELITISGAIFGEVPMISNIDEKIFDFLDNGNEAKAYIKDNTACIEEVSEA